MKKILAVIAAVALTFTFVGCGDAANGILGAGVANGLNSNDDADDDAEVSDSIPKGGYITGTAANAKIDGKNETGDIYREVDLLVTKHFGSRAKIIQENIDANKANGMMGYAFNVSDKKVGEDTVYDLSIVGVTYYQGEPITYVSAFRNVKNLKAQNLGAVNETNANGTVTARHVWNKETDPDGSKFRADTAPCEYEILPLATATKGKRKTALTKYALDEEKKTFTACINVIAEDDGSYTIEWYDPEKVLNATTGAWISSAKLKNLTASDKMTATIPAAVTGYTKKTQAYLGVYANIYDNETLKGSWRLSGIAGEAEVEEFED